MTRFLKWKSISALLILMLLGNFIFGQEFQLSSPKIISGPVFFSGSTSLEIEFDFDGVEIFYAIDNKMNSAEFKKYNYPLSIKEDGVVSYFLEHENFLNSDTGKIEFYEVSSAQSISNLDLFTNPHPDYKGNPDGPLTNQRRGSMNFRDGEWLGFKGEDVNIDFTLEKEIRKGELLVGVLQNAGAWIFGPGNIVLSTYSSKMDKYIEVESRDVRPIAEDDNPKNLLIPFTLNLDESSSRFKLELKKIKTVPAWHSATSDNVWIFVDEILMR